MRQVTRKLALGASSLLVGLLLLSSGPVLAKTHKGDATESVSRSLGSPHKSTKGSATLVHRELSIKGKKVTDARKLFSAKKLPAALPAQSFGSYADGCVAGTVQLPLNGPHWQVMRLSRNRYWGRQELIEYIEHLSSRAYAAGWPGMLIGDLGQPRGGPMPSGHASHQIGLDFDAWLLPDPHPGQVMSMEERETLETPSVLKIDSAELDPRMWTQQRADFVKSAAQDPAVARIFVTPAIKKYFCDRKDPNGADTEWLRRLRSWEGHDEHIHVRLHCPKGERSCGEQDPPPPSDGCGAEVDEWMTKTQADPPYSSHPQPDTPKEPFPMSRLPKACIGVLNAKP
jgi:penicillin-insensitive murein DD-endopeptidase